MSINSIEFIIRYFFVIGVSILLIDYLIIRHKMSPKSKIKFAIDTSVFIIWGLLQWIGGYGTPFFIFLSPIEHPLAGVFWIFQQGYLWGNTAWMFWGNDEGMKGLQESGTPQFNNSHKIKLNSVMFSAVSTLGVIFGYVSGLFNKMVTEIPFETYNLPWP